MPLEESLVEDIEDADTEVVFYTRPEDLAKIRDELNQKELKIKTAELMYRPIVINTITDKVAAERALSFVDKLDSLEDVQRVYANFDIPDELIEDSK